MSIRPLRLPPVRPASRLDAGPTITLSAAFMVYDGYGSMAEYMALSMARAGVTVNIVPLYMDLNGLLPETVELYRRSRPEIRGPVLYFSWPDGRLQRFRRAESLFINTMWETSQLPADWVAPLNLAQTVIVPSRYVADVFRASGVRVPVEVVAQGIDPANYSYIERPEKPGITTLMVGPFDDRKHTREGIAAWKKAFAGDPDARLIIKSQYNYHNYVPDDLRIRYVDRQEPTRGIADWYARADVLMALGNEGFGLPMVEAMATGLPVIALDAEGQADVCAEAGDSLLPVPQRSEQEFGSSIPGVRNVRAVPGIDDIAERLHWVATHQAEARQMGRRASQWALQYRNIWTMGPHVLDVMQRRSSFTYTQAIMAYMMHNRGRETTLERTLDNLSRCDWSCMPVIEYDQDDAPEPQERVTRTGYRLLQRALSSNAEIILFLENDLLFNRSLRFNLEHWQPLARIPRGGHFFGSLYNPGVRLLERDPARAYAVADPQTVFGSQAFVLSRATLKHILDNWDSVEGMPDIRMPRLAAQVSPIYYHTPSLVQHVGRSTWGGIQHTAADYDPDWRAPIVLPTRQTPAIFAPALRPIEPRRTGG